MGVVLVILNRININEFVHLHVYSPMLSMFGMVVAFGYWYYLIDWRLKPMTKLARQLNIAYYWYECVMHMEEPGIEWAIVERQFNA